MKYPTNKMTLMPKTDVSNICSTFQMKYPTNQLNWETKPMSTIISYREVINQVSEVSNQTNGGPDL